MLSADKYSLHRKQDEPQEEAPPVQMQWKSRRWVRLIDNGSEVRKPEPGQTNSAYKNSKRREEDVVCPESSVLNSHCCGSCHSLVADAYERQVSTRLAFLKGELISGPRETALAIRTDILRLRQHFEHV